MIEVIGKHNSAHCFTDELEEAARTQIRNVCDLPEYASSRIRVMPDVHVGVGSTIGMTMTIDRVVSPNMVGVDIGCGIETVELGDKAIDFARLDEVIREFVPAGRNIRRSPHALAEGFYSELDKLHVKDLVKLDRAISSIGTLGGGNHFIEVSRSADGTFFLVVHSGSRHLGLEIANHYQKQGVLQRQQELDPRSKRKSVDRESAYVDGELFDQYIHDMEIATRFALINRKAMIAEICEHMGLTPVTQFSTVHNYIDTESMTLRKGAVSARAGERLLIPLNMRDGSLICVGKGNEDWNQSAPHGAGRIMSRRAAFNSLSMDEYRQEMAAVFTTSVKKDTLDEAPMAYKQMEAITAHISPTVDIIEQIKPVYNFKAAE
jgi:RNA-splicing ligase RtcB